MIPELMFRFPIIAGSSFVESGFFEVEDDVAAALGVVSALVAGWFAAVVVLWSVVVDGV